MAGRKELDAEQLAQIAAALDNALGGGLPLPVSRTQQLLTLKQKVVALKARGYTWAAIASLFPGIPQETVRSTFAKKKRRKKLAPAVAGTEKKTASEPPPGPPVSGSPAAPDLPQESTTQQASELAKESASNGAVTVQPSTSRAVVKPSEHAGIRRRNART